MKKKNDGEVRKNYGEVRMKFYTEEELTKMVHLVRSWMTKLKDFWNLVGFFFVNPWTGEQCAGINLDGEKYLPIYELGTDKNGVTYKFLGGVKVSWLIRGIINTPETTESSA